MSRLYLPPEQDVILESVIIVEKEGSVDLYEASYQQTRWFIVNRLLDIVDRITNGRAGMIQRMFSYLLIGGFTAVINLVVSYVLYEKVQVPIDSRLHNIIALTISFEVALIVNFTLNDYFTFCHLDGHRRAWISRCARYHLTAAVGYLLTLTLQFCFHFFLHTPFFLAQAFAILLVLFYNFSFHHLFTYHRLKSVASVQYEVGS